MPLARYRLVDPGTTPYYHCVSRCVRRAFLCGTDSCTGRNFDHRKQWILNRIKRLSSIFTIDVCAYAIMSNHFHLVLCIDSQAATALSDKEVVARWLQLFKGPELARRHLAGESLTAWESEALLSLVEVWRSRFSDLSWYMRCLNETIARQANAEDNCTGRFWEGRFKSQALLNEAALISCMAYVDLNPIRATICDTLESSEFTSIQERLRDRAGAQSTARKSWLKPLNSPGEPDSREKIPIQSSDYFELVDWTGRAIRQDKRGAIPAHVEPILKKLDVVEKNWVENTEQFGSRFYRALGRVNQIRKLARRSNQCWLHGLKAVQRFQH